MKANISIVQYISIFFVFVFTCLFCNWPNFHPEAQIGMSYHWTLDMLFHGGYFFVATLLLQWILAPYLKTYWICTGLWLLAFLLEITQIWVPGRTFTLLDLVSNTLGITLAGLLFWYGAKRQAHS